MPFVFGRLCGCHHWLLVATALVHVFTGAPKSVVAFGIPSSKRATGWWNTNHFLTFRNQDSLSLLEKEAAPAATISRNSSLYSISFSDMNTNSMNNTSVVQLQPSNKTINSNREERHGIPVLGPFFNEPPLLVGSTLYIDKPTPHQWTSLETSVQLHQEYTNRKRNATTDGFNLTDGFQAAPIVAILDNYTSHVKPNEGRLATLAAIVGISKSSKSENSVVKSALATPLDSKIRLVGIARARLRDFLYENVKDDATEESIDQETEQETEEECRHDHESESDEETGILVTCAECGAHLKIMQHVHEEESVLSNDNDDDDASEAPIVMAEFDLVTDSLKRSTTNEKEEIWYKRAQSTYMSPVHALNEMSTLHNKLMRLHNERRKLVQDIKTAIFRLESNNIFEDFDGIGQVTQKDKNDTLEFHKSQDYNYNDKDAKYSVDPSVLTNLNNYGLDPYSSMSSLLDLTDATMQTLKPYYPTLIQQEEEFRLEITSFVALKALEGFCSSEDMAWALTCTNTVERLQRADEIMTQHLLLMKLKAEQLKIDLKESGQEFADLF